MAGQMGNKQVTTQNLKVVSTDEARGLILVRGAVPGAEGGWVLVKDAVKRPLPEAAPFPAALIESEAEAAPEAKAAEPEAAEPEVTETEAPAEEAAPESAETEAIPESDGDEKKDG